MVERKLFDLVMRSKDTGEEQQLMSLAISAPFDFKVKWKDGHIEIKIDHSRKNIAVATDEEIQHVGYTPEQCGYDK